MADRCDKHPWGTCDGCGVDLGGACCYDPHSLGDYDTLCHECHERMKEAAENQRSDGRTHANLGWDSYNR